MATYKKYEGRLITNYRVEIDYYLDDTPSFNGTYLKMKMVSLYILVCKMLMVIILIS